MDLASHMGVQSFATSRNAQVETFIEYLLEHYCEQLIAEGRINDYKIESQKHYVSDIASDVWDHFVSFYDNVFSNEVELWCQTTCYKGNKTGKPESNKTYEVRETLVEAISFRKYIRGNNGVVRTIHFTVGPKKYTYGWFAPAKEHTFDLSLYLDVEDGDIFEIISEAYEGVASEYQVKGNFTKAIKSATSLGDIISSACSRLSHWHVVESMPIQKFADRQYELVEAEFEDRRTEIEESITRSINAGIDIKKRCNDLVHGADEKDEFIIETVDLLLEKNPFIKNAKRAIADWRSFSHQIDKIAEESSELPDFIRNLWNSDKDLRLLVRRLLFRINASGAINYVQDVEIQGVTEHNLYKGDHTEVQVNLIIDHIMERLSCSTVDTLRNDLISNKAKGILRSSIWFEARNGTDLRPSFDYIEIVLKSKGFNIRKASSLTDKPVGYHAQLVNCDETVNPYTNLKVIVDSDGCLLAFLKGKYFRPQEFPRRCKEEAYVALTLKHHIVNGRFKERVLVPIIMFIDMPEDYTPPEYALKRLECFGWHSAFSVDDIVALVNKK